MIEETAVIKSCDGEYAWVEAQRKSACGQCSVNKGCGTSVLARVIGKRVSRMKALNHAQASQGDHVLIGLHESAMLSGAAAVYLVPLLAFIFTAIVGQFIGDALAMQSSELVSIVFAAAGLAIAVIWLRRFSRKIQNDERYQAVVLKRLHTANLIKLES